VFVTLKKKRKRRNPLIYQWLPLLFGPNIRYNVVTYLLAERQPTPFLFSELGGHVAFDIGDKVIYPNHGLGVIERIETKTIMGTTCGFYQLRMANETTVFVPVDNVDGVGLRRAINDEEVQRLFDLLGDGKIDSHQNWKGRFKDNSDRMRTGSIYDVVEVLKSLTFLSKSKSLSFREKRMLDRAKFLVVSEITEVLAEKTPVVEEKVDKALEHCFLTKARNAARAKAAAAAPPPAPRTKPQPAAPARVAPAPARRTARAS
jgi:CarD family transcriptional regulator